MKKYFLSVIVFLFLFGVTKTTYGIGLNRETYMDLGFTKYECIDVGGGQPDFYFSDLTCSYSILFIKYQCSDSSSYGFGIDSAEKKCSINFFDKGLSSFSSPESLFLSRPNNTKIFTYLPGYKNNRDLIFQAYSMVIILLIILFILFLFYKIIKKIRKNKITKDIIVENKNLN